MVLRAFGIEGLFGDTVTATDISSVMSYEITKRYEIPIDHLDYGFIEKCTDVKHLEKILHTLRSGEEGHYPDLTTYCEKQIEKLSPHSRALRKDKPPATATDFSLEDWKQIDGDFKNWLTDIKMKDQQKSTTPHNIEDLPSIRNFSSSSSANKEGNEKKETKTKVPRDYKDWDRFDVEKEISKIEECPEKKEKSKAIINSTTSKIKKTIDTAGVSQEQRCSMANQEKDKGNEAFRSGDYEEAVAYYSRSISVIPTAAAYNNRAQAEIKLKNWQNALNDCERVLALEADNMKALLRRATVYKNLCNYQAAASDLNTVLHHEPSNPVAKKALDEVENLLQKAEEETVSKGVRLLIQDVEGSAEEEADPSSCQQEAGVTVGGETAEQRVEMGNTQKKFSPTKGKPRGYEDQPSKPETASMQNGVSKDCGNGQQARTQCSKNGSQETQRIPASETTPQNQPSLPLTPAEKLKSEGNQLFKNGQFGEASIKYSEAIEHLIITGPENAEELGVLYSNRAACRLKEGNSRTCIEDCNRSLELQPFSIKPLLRRAMAHESLERYRDAYVDYKIVLQIDAGMQVANDSINRITRTLIDQDGSSWRENLPPIPAVPVSVHLQRHEAAVSSAVHSGNPGENNQQKHGKSAEERFTSLKLEGNEYVKKNQYKDAEKKYTECLKINSEECTIYTNRALCYLKLCQYEEARQDCESALQRDASNIKALYRRAQAHKGLENYQESATDLQKVLSLEPNNNIAQGLLTEVTLLLKKPRKKIVIEEVWETDDTPEHVETGESGSTHLCHNGGPQSHGPQETTTKLHITKPTNAYEFGQRMNEVKAGKDMLACAELLAAVEPKDLPVFLSNKLEGDTLLLIIRSLNHSLLDQNPTLVYHHLSYLTQAERFQVVTMLLNINEKNEVQSLFTALSEKQLDNINPEDLLDLSKRFEL
ncbi:sperm-associated antigen 1 [Pelodytes ibericus]